MKTVTKKAWVTTQISDKWTLSQQTILSGKKILYIDKRINLSRR